MQKNIHKVKQGDSLQTLSKTYNISEDVIAQENSLTSPTLKEGDRLVISLSSSQRYFVKPFDTLNSIAKAKNLSIDKLKSINNISEVFVGQIIELY